jgi:hypothetical protein
MVNNEQQDFTRVNTKELFKKNAGKALEGQGYWVFLIR